MMTFEKLENGEIFCRMNFEQAFVRINETKTIECDYIGYRMLPTTYGYGYAYQPMFVCKAEDSQELKRFFDWSNVIPLAQAAKQD